MRNRDHIIQIHLLFALDCLLPDAPVLPNHTRGCACAAEISTPKLRTYGSDINPRIPRQDSMPLICNLHPPDAGCPLIKIPPKQLLLLQQWFPTLAPPPTNERQN